MVYVEMLKIVQDSKVRVERKEGVVREEELSEKMNIAILECIKKVCSEEAIKSADMIKDMSIRITGIGDIKMKQDSISYEHVYVQEVPRPPKGLIEHAAKLFLHKGYYTSETKTEMKTTMFDVGVNDADITTNIMLKLEDVFKNSVTKYIEKLINGYYLPIERLQTDSVEEIADAINRLRELKI